MAIVKVNGVSADDRFPGKTLKVLARFLKKPSARIQSAARDVKDAVGFTAPYELDIYLNVPGEEFDPNDLKTGVEFIFPENKTGVKTKEEETFELICREVFENDSLIKVINWRADLRSAYETMLES